MCKNNCIGLHDGVVDRDQVKILWSIFKKSLMCLSQGALYSIMDQPQDISNQHRLNVYPLFKDRVGKIVTEWLRLCVFYKHTFLYS